MSPILKIFHHDVLLLSSRYGTRLVALDRANLYPRKYCCYDLSRDYATDNTGKRNFCRMKTNFFLVYFSMLNSNMLLEFLHHPQFFCDRIFYIEILANLIFLCYHYVLNMAEALYDILNVV